MKLIACRASGVSIDGRRRRAPYGFLVAALALVMSSAGCISSGDGGGSGNSGGTAAAQGSGGAGFSDASASGSGGGTGSGGSMTSGGSSGATGASGGSQGGGGIHAGSGGGAGASAPTGVGGTGKGGASASGGQAGKLGTSGSGGSGGGKGSTGGAATGGSTGVAGGSSGGHGGSGGIAVAGHSGTGGTATGGTGAGGTVSTATLLADLANAFCAAARTCCAQKPSVPTSLGDCEAQFSSRLWGLSFVNKGTETIDKTALSACILGYKQTSTTCAFQPLEAACKGVFVGTKPEGAACGKGGTPMIGGVTECQTTGRVTQCLWTGDSNLSTTTGICQSPVHAKKGEPCASTCGKNERCTFDLLTSPGYPTAVCLEEDGLYCSSAVMPSVCASVVPTGGNCEAEASASCASTDYCDQSGATATCRKAATLGQACPSAGPYCANGMSLECGTSNLCEDLGFAYDTTCGGTPPFPL